jgi:hypothetical protein
VFNLNEDGTFEISHDDATRKYLLSHVNDNIFQNLDSKTISLSSYDSDKLIHKNEMDIAKKNTVIDELI